MEKITFAAIHYKGVRERILQEAPDLDEETLADTLEGLTDLHEIVAAIIRSVLWDEAIAASLKARINDMQCRLARIDNRASKRRQIARDVMLEIDLKKITAPDFTISVRPGGLSLAVTNERAIPADFWESREPRLNRQALLAELKLGTEIPGAQLSNGEPVLSVRTR